MKYKQLSSIYYSDNGIYEKVYEKRLNSESTYRFKFKVFENEAFVVINNYMLQSIEKIMELDKRLYIAVHSVPPIALSQYTKKCLIDEIKMTNDIEGVYSTRKEINDILENMAPQKGYKRLYGVVTKYQMLLNGESINLLTCNDIRSLYDEFALKDVVNENEENAPDGEIFRKSTVSVISPNQKVIHEGIYPEARIISTMSECLDMLNNDDYNLLIRIAVFHYMFGYIHPFYDGNGRTSRFISSYLLNKKLEPLVSYRLSYAIKENINSYYKSFKEANDKKNKGDLTGFVLDFFKIIISSIEELCDSIEEKSSQLEYYKGKIKNMFKNDDKLNMILFILIQNSLFGEKGLSIQELKSICHVGESKTRSIIKKLKECDLVITNKVERKYVYNVNLDKI